ncbi:MAG TPA: GNAT family protein [Sporichthyaceae bacterium]|nr:GNAT family protein [Sporichthyaceae bacterium]
MPALLPTGEPLAGPQVRLEPLHERDLLLLGKLLRDPELYASGFGMHRQAESFADAVSLARERYLRPGDVLDGRGGGRLAYVVHIVDPRLGEPGTVVGTSTLAEADLTNEKIHLGNTVYGRPWWGSAVNPAAKLLLLGHCFDDCGYGRVRIQTDVVNKRSAAAIERLGAVREGVARRDQRREDGTFRDTVMFSILATEWPAVRAGLLARIAVQLPG